MKSVAYHEIVERVAGLCGKAAFELPGDVDEALAEASKREQSPLGKSILEQCRENARLAQSEGLAICQDTGFAVYFVELGSGVRIEGGELTDALAEATEKGYAEGFLRRSIVSDPVFDRKNTGTNTPPVVHILPVPGDTLRITLAPKGGGSENMSALAMLKPAEGREGIVRFVSETVIQAGGNPCPPTIVGVGIGGTFEKAALLAKKALLRPVGSPHPDPRYAELEKDILEMINASGVGPQGLGGTVTALAVHVEHFPCHIASLPVAVNLNCHAARHATAEWGAEEL
jgi:fumarate hydratase subunit alpha